MALASALDRASPSVAMAQSWHRNLYAGCALPVSYYAGEVRNTDSRFPELIGYEVIVGESAGAPSASVPARLAAFETAAVTAVAALDDVVAPGSPPGTAGVLGSVLIFVAGMHGEWVRIHPFANGNGRTARIWANWSLARYSLPPVVRLRPRPAGDAYAMAAAASMAGDHAKMVALLNTQIRNRVTNP